MTLTVQLKLLPEDPKVLLDLMENFNVACNWLSKIAFEEKLWHWLPLQRRTYYELREKFGMTAAQALVAIRKVAYAYKDKKRRGSLAEFRPRGSMPLFKHVYYGDGTVRFYGIWMPRHSRVGLSLPKHPKEGKLSYRDGEFYIHQCVEIGEADPIAVNGWLGCDLGIVNILVDSEGGVFSGNATNGLRHRHARQRAKLQSKGTKSAKRLLMKRRRKESRFARDVNHVISKKVVAKATRQRLGIALEDLQGIRERMVVRKAQRRIHHSWAFAQLRSFIEYKALRDGIPICIVDARNTSRTCPHCGHCEKSNRKSQNDFLCVRCGFSGLADHVAATNIGRRAVGNQPYAGLALAS